MRGLAADFLTVFCRERGYVCNGVCVCENGVCVGGIYVCDSCDDGMVVGTMVCVVAGTMVGGKNRAFRPLKSTSTRADPLASVLMHWFLT